MSIEAKNCPFCGRKPEIIGDDFPFARCMCGISAIPLEIWNNRPAEDVLARRVDELSDTVAKLTGKKRFRGDETILYAAHREMHRRFEARIAELEKSLCEINREINHLN